MRFLTLLLFIIIFGLIPNPSTHAQITWDDPLGVAGSDHDNNHPRIVTDASGNPLVVWNDGQKVLFARWNGNDFTSPVALNPDSVAAAGASWMGPDIATHGDTVYIVYKEKPEAESSSHIWCLSSFDGGSTFSQPVRVDDIGQHLSRFPTVTTDDAGHPLVAFMKFEPGFHNGQWVVTSSDDGGISFSADVQASGWSSPTAEVCDCCPGVLVSSGDRVAMVYRDNNNNIRDNWAAFSYDGGATFDRGMNIDQHNWYIETCPAVGPDAVIVDDTLYSTFMNGAGPLVRSYYNKTSLSAQNGTKSNTLTDYIPGLSQQNYPRIAGSGKAVAIVWRQITSNSSQLPILFARNIQNGIPSEWDTVTTNYISNADVAVSDNQVFVVWQDLQSGTVQFRSGSYGNVTEINPVLTQNRLRVYPNPSSYRWSMKGRFGQGLIRMELYDTKGSKVYSEQIEHPGGRLEHSIDNVDWDSGIYFLHITTDKNRTSLRVLKR